MKAQDIADFIADTGMWPGSLKKKQLFGLVMNSERIVNRRARRELAYVTLAMSRSGAPYEIFRAAAFTYPQAHDEYSDYALAIERLAEAAG